MPYELQVNMYQRLYCDVHCFAKRTSAKDVRIELLMLQRSLLLQNELLSIGTASATQ